MYRDLRLDHNEAEAHTGFRKNFGERHFKRLRPTGPDIESTDGAYH